MNDLIEVFKEYDKRKELTIEEAACLWFNMLPSEMNSEPRSTKGKIEARIEIFIERANKYILANQISFDGSDEFVNGG